MFKFLVALTCLVLGSTSSLRAQVLYGSVVGNVVDSSDAAVAGASVTITNRETRQTRETTTNESGAYSFPTLSSGSYDLKIVKEGFSSTTRGEP